MGRTAVTLLGSVLSGAYWWAVFTLVYAPVLFAGDRNPALPPPPDREVIVRNVALILGGILVYAALTALWRRVAGRRR